MPATLKKCVLASLVFHLIVVVFSVFNPFGNNLDFKESKITWITMSRGDGGTSKTSSFPESKGLPQSTIREQKMARVEQKFDKEGSDLKSHEAETRKTAPQKESLKRTSENSGVNLKTGKKTPAKNKTKSKINDALARIDQTLKQRQVDMGVAQANTTDTGQSPWGSDRGGSDIDPALVEYQNKLIKKIIQEWALAKGEFAGQLVTQIIVLIDSQGNVIRSDFKKTSGDGSFDASAMRAIKRSAPFPIPPQSILEEALSEGFEIEFNPTTVAGGEI